ncbi:MAG: hypothetical protein CL678_11090 [Bdellovibrionaceae bacterium]|nr:hypothetical protein [Pseudobdellovibrionaceae bacterium]|tara:strand:+ start:11091 stop:11675 length:585 start_codon:yes stop_codon:yes gene_type:complete
MTTTKQNHFYSAFDDKTLLVQGELDDVVIHIKKHLGKSENSSILIFSDSTGATIDFNFQGTKQDVLKRLDMFRSPKQKSIPSGPGRPRLGVISREISLLPRHWEWLATQSGGASATLRRLVEEAQKKSSQQVSTKQIQERVYKVMSVLAGDLQGYEEALRALYKKDRKTFFSQIEIWPKDIKKYLKKIGKPIFE